MHWDSNALGSAMAVMNGRPKPLAKDDAALDRGGEGRKSIPQSGTRISKRGQIP